MTCDKVVIISKGRIVGEGSPESLTEQLREGGVLRAQVAGPREAVEGLLTGIEGVVDVQYEDAGQDLGAYLVTTVAGQDVRDPLAKAIVDGGYGLRELRSMDMSLEDVFLRLTNEERVEA